ncbi:hypothetical protein HPB51_022857 [Rhipicephalus microplus]|uniref:Uncharacterized protein n=1 Tax=Rhipicephalus microplus TaxID=6941 RepID=A0A9J6DQ49_RHIMP|nr:hypothetical protein HPB51_022857 [Rhipicephalus microplus]
MASQWSWDGIPNSDSNDTAAVEGSHLGKRGKRFLVRDSYDRESVILRPCSAEDTRSGGGPKGGVRETAPEPQGVGRQGKGKSAVFMGGVMTRPRDGPRNLRRSMWPPCGHSFMVVGDKKGLEQRKIDPRRLIASAERAKLEEQLANVQATLREQHARHEDVPAMKQRQHRLQQDITAARSQLEALRQQHELSSLKFYNTDEKLRSEHAKLQASFRSSTTCLRRVLPRNALDDFDMRPVEDARSLQRHVASNTAAAAKVTDMLDRMEKELQGCILQNHDLCEQYTFKVEDLERELQLKQELIAKRKSYWAEQTADTRKNAHDLDKEYADICKATSDLQQLQIHDPDIKAAQEAEKR